MSMQKRKPVLQQVPIELLKRGQYQPRQHFDQEKLHELAESIKTTDGLLQPIVARPLRQGYFEIVAGERRWRAAQIAGLMEVSCLIYPYTDEQALQAAIVENINRSDLNPIEEAKAYQRLIDEFQYLHEEVAASVGKSRAAITNALRLLKLDSRVQEMLINQRLSEGHGKILAGLLTHEQLPLAERAIKYQWSVRRIEQEIKKLQKSNTTEQSHYSDQNIKHLEAKLAEHVGNRVNVQYEDKGGGYLQIRFNNIDELEGHFDKIGFQYETELKIES